MDGLLQLLHQAGDLPVEYSTVLYCNVLYSSGFLQLLHEPRVFYLLSTIYCVLATPEFHSRDAPDKGAAVDKHVDSQGDREHPQQIDEEAIALLSGVEKVRLREGMTMRFMTMIKVRLSNLHCMWIVSSLPTRSISQIFV